MPTRQSGFTVIEALVFIVVMSVISLIGHPRFRDTILHTQVKEARDEGAMLHARARASAVETGRLTTLTFTATQAVITAAPRLVALAGSTVDTIGGVADLGGQFGVTVTASPTAVLTVDPRGLGSVTATTVYFTRSGLTDSMVVSGFGRVAR